MIRPCTCINEFQDKELGKGNRTMNECKKGQAVRCTSCLKEFPYSGKQVETKSKGKNKK